jgi:hypothetical protein
MTTTDAPKYYEIKPADGGDPLPAELATATAANVEEILLKAAKLRYPKETQLKVVRGADGKLFARRFFKQGQPGNKLFVAIPTEAPPPAPPAEGETTSTDASA